MDTSGMIDLGREYDSPCCCAGDSSDDKKGEKKISYPSLYVSGVEQLPELPDGDFYILAKVSVCRMTVDKKNDDNSLELEVKSMKPVGAAPSKKEKDAYAEMADLAERGSAGLLADAMEMEDEEE
jgi:hypothetical protein